MGERLGEQFGNYRLTRLLGKGGFADVYLGEHMHIPNHRAAIKILHTSLTKEDVEKFRAEAGTLADLVHPRIVRLLDFSIEGMIPYVVMDYAPNGSLLERHPRGTRLPLEMVVSYVMQIAEALDYAHEHRLVHRDIKPANFLLGRRNEVLLGDFGIATLTQSARSRTLAACRRERTGSHASRSVSACVVHGTGTSARTACGRKQNRVSDGDPTNWKDAPIPTLRPG
jgi:serine/threonine protein kinase